MNFKNKNLVIVLASINVAMGLSACSKTQPQPSNPQIPTNNQPVPATSPAVPSNTNNRTTEGSNPSQTGPSPTSDSPSSLNSAPNSVPSNNPGPMVQYPAPLPTFLSPSSVDVTGDRTVYQFGEFSIVQVSNGQPTIEFPDQTSIVRSENSDSWPLFFPIDKIQGVPRVSEISCHDLIAHMNHYLSEASARRQVEGVTFHNRAENWSNRIDEKLRSAPESILPTRSDSENTEISEFQKEQYRTLFTQDIVPLLCPPLGFGGTQFSRDPINGSIIVNISCTHFLSPRGMESLHGSARITISGSGVITFDLTQFRNRIAGLDFNLNSFTHASEYRAFFEKSLSRSGDHFEVTNSSPSESTVASIERTRTSDDDSQLPQGYYNIYLNEDGNSQNEDFFLGEVTRGLVIEHLTGRQSCASSQGSIR